MAAVKWEAVAPYVERVIKEKGTAQYGEMMNLALADNASDDVVDALDAVGSRVFSTPEQVRDFLVAQGYVNK